MTEPLYAVLGRVPSGIFILTVGSDDLATGMLASWVMQAGFEPPMVTVAVRRDRYVAEWLTNGELFVLNLVAEGQKHLLKHFGRGFEPGEPAFTGLDIRPTDSGPPALVDAIGILECVPEKHVDAADHRIFLARVATGFLANDERPMVHIRSNGAHY